MSSKCHRSRQGEQRQHLCCSRRPVLDVAKLPLITQGKCSTLARTHSPCNVPALCIIGTRTNDQVKALRRLLRQEAGVHLPHADAAIAVDRSLPCRAATYYRITSASLAATCAPALAFHRRRWPLHQVPFFSGASQRSRWPSLICSSGLCRDGCHGAMIMPLRKLKPRCDRCRVGCLRQHLRSQATLLQQHHAKIEDCGSRRIKTANQRIPAVSSQGLLPDH